MTKPRRWIASEEQYKITASQNESDIKTAEVTLQLKRIDLNNFLEGSFTGGPQSETRRHQGRRIQPRATA